MITAAGHIGNLNPLRYRGYYYDGETGLYYLRSRYYDPVVCRFVNADGSLYHRMLGYNLFAYCNNNPVNHLDPTGKSATVLNGWVSSMWWLSATDGALPIGEIIYVGGAIVIGLFLLDSLSVYESEDGLEDDFDHTQQVPDVEYPGNDPAVAPGEDYEWHGKPGEPIGSDKGAWVNPNTGEQWHPDLNHPFPKGPHWEYTDPYGIKWHVTPGGEIKIW